MNTGRGRSSIAGHIKSFDKCFSIRELEELDGEDGGGGGVGTY